MLDPLARIGALRDVRLVVKAGEIVRVEPPVLVSEQTAAPNR